MSTQPRRHYGFPDLHEELEPLAYCLRSWLGYYRPPSIYPRPVRPKPLPVRIVFSAADSSIAIKG